MCVHYTGNTFQSTALHFSEDELDIHVAVVIGVESANRSNMCIEVLWSLTRYIHA